MVERKSTSTLLGLVVVTATACGPVSGFPDTGTGAMDAGSDAPDAAVVNRTDAILQQDAPRTVQGPPQRDCVARFTYPLGRMAGSVAVAGTWNMFSTSAMPMVDGLYTGVYRASAALAPGSYGYKFVADNVWSLDPTNGLSYYVNGTENSRVDVPDCTLPTLRVDGSDTDPRTRTITLTLQYLDGSARAGVDPSALHVTMNRADVPATAVRFDGNTGRLTVSVQVPENGKYTFRFDVSDRMGHAARQRLVPMWMEDEPFQWSDGPLYFVFTDRFRNGNMANDAPVAGVDARANYQGGDLQGVLTALRDGYFERLGVRSLWLSPVNNNTESSGRGGDGRPYSAYHGYWVTAPRAVEEHFGTMEDLRAVTTEAHRRGIRVLIDLVNNQLHQQHPYFTQHRDWFNGDGSCVCGGPNCGWDDHMLDCWFTSYLPDVNWTNMQAVDQMVSDALWWLSEADIDGFRVDAVKHMPHIASTTLRLRIREEMETGNARYYLVGETFTGSDGAGLVQSFISDRELWGQFDFPLFWSITGVLGTNGGTMRDLDNAVLNGERTYRNALMSPFLGNHDVERFLSRAAGQLSGNTQDQAWSNPPPRPTTDDPYNRAALAFTFLLTQPGVPLIYTGDEVGTPGAADPDNRRFLTAESALTTREQNLLNRVRAVGHARSTHPGLRRGARRTLYTDDDAYVFARGADTALALVALNRGSTARMVHVTVPPELCPDGVSLHDLLGSQPGTVTVQAGAVDLPVGAQGTSIWVR